MKRLKTVLLADDELWLPEDRFKQSFKRARFKLILVEDIGGLLEKWRSADVLVVDARMPTEFNGIDAVVGLVESGQLPPSVPIIFISVFSEDRVTHRSKLPLLHNKRRHLWVTKPVDLHYLFIKIREELAIVNQSN